MKKGNLKTKTGKCDDVSLVYLFIILYYPRMLNDQG